MNADPWHSGLTYGPVNAEPSTQRPSYSPPMQTLTKASASIFDSIPLLPLPLFLPMS